MAENLVYLSVLLHKDLVVGGQEEVWLSRQLIVSMQEIVLLFLLGKQIVLEMLMVVVGGLLFPNIHEGGVIF